MIAVSQLVVQKVSYQVLEASLIALCSIRHLINLTCSSIQLQVGRRKDIVNLLLNLRVLSNHEPVPSPILLLRVLLQLLKCLIAQLDRILFDDVANAPKSQHVARLYDYALNKNYNSFYN